LQEEIAKEKERLRQVLIKRISVVKWNLAFRGSSGELFEIVNVTRQVEWSSHFMY